MDQLSTLGLKYGTDKIGKHHYLPVYYELFKNRQYEVRRVLEIGVAEHAGIRMFRDFFPKAQIDGVDNEIDRVFNEERIEVYYFNQSDKKEREEMSQFFMSDYDLIIDDGSHKPEDQLYTCLELLGNLSLEGIYVIEDVSDERIAKQLKEELIKQDRQLHWSIEVVKVGNRYDDRLVTVRLRE